VARSEENTAEAIAEAVTAGRKVVVELRKTKGATYSPSEEEAKAILQDCLDAIEKDFGARATRYGAPDIAPRNAAPAPVARKTIPVTTPASGGTRPPPEEPKPAKGDLMTEKAALVRRVRQASRQTAE
jgi:hypothetical protein